MIGGWVLDAGTLRRFAAGSSVYAQAVVWTAVEEALVLLVPATGLAKAVAETPEQDRPVLGVLLDLPVTVVDPLGRDQARDVGHLLGPTNADQLAAGHAVHCARQRGWPLLTDTPTTARQLDDQVDVRELP